MMTFRFCIEPSKNLSKYQNILLCQLKFHACIIVSIKFNESSKNNIKCNVHNIKILNIIMLYSAVTYINKKAFNIEYDFFLFFHAKF